MKREEYKAGLTAIDESIEKWRNIKNGEYPLIGGTKPCSMCWHFSPLIAAFGIDCTACPLELTGNQCTSETVSNWGRYYDIMDDFCDPDHLTINSKPIEDKKDELDVCINQMLRNLVKARKWWVDTKLPRVETPCQTQAE